ncbi:MAG: biopolymer transporter ExbD, partial [Verrucomicrobiae bacterium]|nr:biopolymer transporter ExbD [Verrucomicrobiae bacterium]
MRRYSQKHSLVTLSEINITPLLDLAFVLLIIFIITTPLLEKSINLKLPKGGETMRAPNKNDLKTVEISAQGEYRLGGRRMTVQQIEQELVLAFQQNPNTLVAIRADERASYGYIAAV